MTFILSGFADEYSANFSEQVSGFNVLGIKNVELRFIDGENVSILNQKKVLEIKEKLCNANIKVSAIGSPLGKISIDDDMQEHLRVAENVFKIAKELNCEYVRVFSFYLNGKQRKDVFLKVCERLEKLISLANKYGVKLCHENEEGLYGQSPEQCYKILKLFGGKYYYQGKEYEMPFHGIPMNKDYVGNSLDNPLNLELNVFNGNGKFDLYEDDDDKKVFITQITSEHQEGIQTIRLSFNGDSSVVPENREIFVRFKNIINGNVIVRANDKVIECESNSDVNLVVKIDNLDYSSQYEITVSFKEQTQLERLKSQAEYSIFRFEGANMVRHYLYQAIQETQTVDEFKAVVKRFEEEMPEMDAQLIEEVRVLLSKTKHWKTLPKIYAKRLLETI